ncbi:acyltransferase [Liquorilactobacillus hordei]|uniref:acyltransferase n=1 Tax=Liquorilactobacillus hordei TaxID=468911 RepID=UPI0039E955B2
MILVKIINAIHTYQTKIWYSLIFKRRIVFGKRIHFRRAFNLTNTGKVIIGDNCFFNNYCSINCRKYIKIGTNTIFGENVKIYDHNHKFSDKSKKIKDQGYSEASVIIGDDCWIGSNVTILKGVVIGNRCVIGAGVTLKHSISDQSIVSMNENNININKIKFDN